MAQGYFEVELTIREAGPGEVAFGAPEALYGVDWSYVLVDESQQRALVKVVASAEQIKKLAKDPGVQRLGEKELDTAARSYPTPRLKQLRDDQVMDPDTGEVTEGELRTLQTVRVDFHLVDVPVDPTPVAEAVGGVS